MCLENVAIDIDNVAVEQLYEVFAADIEQVVAGAIVLVNLEAACLEQIRDIIVAEERLAYFEAAPAPESTIDVVYSNNGVT